MNESGIMPDVDRSIYVSTIIDSYNYGTVIQALATKTILEKYGEVRFIDYLRNDWTWRGWFESAFQVKHLGRFGFLKRLVGGFPNRVRGWRVFRVFIKRHLVLCGKHPWNSNGFNADNSFFCTGSDQTWNYECNNGMDAIYFLEDVPSDFYKFSFCASFGRNEIGASEAEATQRLLASYKALSIRENSGARILNKLGFSDVKVLPDPTLIAGIEQLNKYALNKKVSNENYLLIYQLNEDSRLRFVAEQIASIFNLQIIQVSFSWHKRITKGWRREFLPPIPKWLALFRDASYVVTDSFHGTCFSILNNKSFNVVLPSSYSVRLVDGLSAFGLTSRIVAEGEDPDTSPINWDSVNINLEAARAEADTFLSKVLNSKGSINVE